MNDRHSLTYNTDDLSDGMHAGGTGGLDPEGILDIPLKPTFSFMAFSFSC